MPVSIKGQFRRSVHLERDFYGAAAANGYIITAKAREVIGRVAEALAAPVAQRAWSVTGPYGGGKSAFALFLAHLLRGGAAAREHLAEADPELARAFQAARSGVFCPILVVGSREPLVPALLRGLVDGVEAFGDGFARNPGRPSEAVRLMRRALRRCAEEARTALEQEDASSVARSSDAFLLELVERVAEAVHAATGGGAFIVVDELGKLLEYAALYPERSDLFALQRLAERSSRAGRGDGDGAGAPILLFTILHQAFERYAGRLASTQQDEWRKVQGRFEDIAFVEPVSETLRLLAEAIVVEEPEQLPPHAKDLVESTLRQVQLPAHAELNALRDHLRAALPLHPAVALLVGPLFRRLAQNERSLFAFLGSAERHSFLEVVERREAAPPCRGRDLSQQPLYRLDHLYDYLVANLGSTLFSERMEKLWAETEAALSGIRLEDPLAPLLVKHVALLGFAGALAGLKATSEMLAATADAPPERVNALLDELRSARLLAYRQFGGTYHVWQGSDFDLEACLREAREHVSSRIPLATLLTRTVPPAPLVARRHSYRTGTNRVFEVVYATDKDWPTAVVRPHKRADGRVVYVLPEHDDVEAVVVALRDGVTDEMTLAAIPDGLAALREHACDLACLDWVREHADELAGDPVARREIAEQRGALAAEVERRLSMLLHADKAGRNPCTWIYRGEAFRLDSERALQNRLSDICNAVYPLAPEVWNELLSRRKPSSAAVRGLKLLLDAMIRAGNRARLDIDGSPAEFGMYASVLKATGMHRPDEEGGWHFVRPEEDERPGCAAVWDRIGEVLRSGGGRPVPLREVFAAVSSPPYGVREGLIPVFLFAYVQSEADNVAFYEDGTFVRELTFETTERLLKSQEKQQDRFEVQWVEVDSLRAHVLAELAPLVGLSRGVRKPLPVAIRILRHVHELPTFVRRTGNLSDKTTAVRAALERARDPVRLIFEDLPEACGAGSFLDSAALDEGHVRRFSKELQASLRELGGAYDALLASVQELIARAFRLRAADGDGLRRELAQRARALMPVASDLHFKAFLVRASDEMLDVRAWTESIAALVAKQPPAQWSDEDAMQFRVRLFELARSFTNLEPLALDLAADETAVMTRVGTHTGKETRTRGAVSAAGAPLAVDGQRVRRVRLLVKTLNEDEQDGIIHVHPEDDDLIRDLYGALAEVLDAREIHPDTKLAALGRLATDLLKVRSEAMEAYISTDANDA